MAKERPFGRYILEDRIAMGGMAEIFRARTATEGFEKRVCIKRVLPHFLESPDFVAMFRDEAALAARLQHANVVHVFDFGDVEGALYLAMELVDGADLRKLLDRADRQGKPLGPGQAAQIAIEMARGLHHAHTLTEGGAPLHIVHRDISPHNVLLSSAGEVKITDFGIAKAAQRSTHTSTGVVKGKLSYMAPEQADGSGVDHRVDQFATGVVLWEMLTGQRLFSGENDAIILRKVLTCEVPPPSEVNASVPKELEAIVMKALAPGKDDRYATMRAFEQALTRAVFALSDDPDFTDLRPWVQGLSATDPGPRRTMLLEAASGPESPPAPGGPAAAEPGSVSSVFAPASASHALRASGLEADHSAETVLADATLVADSPLSSVPSEVPEPTGPTRTVVPAEVMGEATTAHPDEATVTRTDPAAPSDRGAGAPEESTLPRGPVDGPRDATTEPRLSTEGSFSAASQPPAAFPRRNDDEAVVPTERVPRTPTPPARSRRVALVGGLGALGVASVVAVWGLSGTPAPASTTGGAASTTTGAAAEPPPSGPPAGEPTEPTPAATSTTTADVDGVKNAGAPTDDEAAPDPPAPPAPEAVPGEAGAGATAAADDDGRRSRPRARPAARRPPPAAKGTGKVYIEVQGGWAVIYRGKTRLGESPTTVSLPAGTQRLRLVNPETGKEKSVKVKVVADQTVHVSERL